MDMAVCDLSLSSVVVRIDGNITVCMVGLLLVVLCRCVLKSRRGDVIMCVGGNEERCHRR